MNIGIIGLGRMGNAIAQRCLQANHTVYGFDPSEHARHEARKIGVQVVESIKDLASDTRTVMLMIPAGEPVEQALKELAPHMKAGDVIIDGGNSFYKDSMRRAKMLHEQGIFFLDCGTSGGVQGLGNGFCLMVGGDIATYRKVHPLFAAMVKPGGLAYIGPSGTGHYVKMIHNGIEYGLMQAYAEGFQVIKEGSFEKDVIDLEEVSRIWDVSSVIRSWLLDLAHNVFEKDEGLHDISGEIGGGQTGKWAAEEAEEHDIRTPALDAALEVRKWSQESGGNYATKVIAMLREQFGGHPVKKIKGKDENH